MCRFNYWLSNHSFFVYNIAYADHICIGATAQHVDLTRAPSRCSFYCMVY